MRGEVHFGLDTSQRVSGTGGLAATDVGATVQQLSMQVRFGNGVGVDDREVTHARCRKIAQYGAA